MASGKLGPASRLHHQQLWTPVVVPVDSSSPDKYIILARHAALVSQKIATLDIWSIGRRGVAVIACNLHLLMQMMMLRLLMMLLMVLIMMVMISADSTNR